MARVIKSREKRHTLTIAADRGCGEVILVGRGKRAYLWSGTFPIVTVSGPATLRKLAWAILREVGDDRETKRRRSVSQS